MDSRRHFLRGLARVAAGGGRPGAAGESPAAPAQDPGVEALPGTPATTPSAHDPTGRYAAALADPHWSATAQDAVGRSSVLVIGAGAIGTPVLGYLAGAGVGRLGVLDDAVVALGDLYAETIHYTPDVGVSKAHSAAAKLAFLNPEVVVEPYQVHIDADNAENLLDGHDLVVDCSNSDSVRPIVAATCARLGVPLATAGARADGGWIISVPDGEHACPACAGLEAGEEPAIQPGTAAGVVGSLLAREALNRLAAGREASAGSVVHLDLAAPELRRSAVTRRPSCPVCGSR